MAGSQITTYTTIITGSMKGFMAVTLDEWTTLLEPEITEGSRVEISGSLFKFDALEDIDASGNWAGFGNSTQIYGYFLVAGASVTCELTKQLQHGKKKNKAGMILLQVLKMSLIILLYITILQKDMG